MSQRGSTLIESLVAFSLFAGAALAVYPLFVKAKEESKSGDFRQTCEHIVRTKLDEYRSGRIVDLKTQVEKARGENDPAPERLSRLSIYTLSDSSIQTGQVDLDKMSGLSSGFLYAKVRYNRFFPYSCRGESTAKIFDENDAPPMKLGMRECISSAADEDPKAWEEKKGDTTKRTCESTIDQRIASQLPGFKLYVKLTQYNPFRWDAATGPDNNKQWGEDLANEGDAPVQREFSRMNKCPNFGLSPDAIDDALPPLYDFNGAGDGIQVTVTGVVDIADVGDKGLSRIGNLARRDANGNFQKYMYQKLICSASTVISPPSFPFRYYLSRSDGRIYSVHGGELNHSSEATADLQGFQVFNSLYDDKRGHTGIKSFAVHPLNDSIMILKSGVLEWHTGCGGVPINCPRDTGAEGPVYHYPIDSNIIAIGVNFYQPADEKPRVYALRGDRKSFYAYNFTNRALEPLSTTTSGTMSIDEKVLLSDYPADSRIISFFLDPYGTEVFSVAPDTIDAISDTAYPNAIYRNVNSAITQRFLQSPLMHVPVNAIGFSR